MSRIFGHILGVEVGDTFSDRLELSVSGVHRPRQAGISGSQNEGADSIVVSGGYEDDQDLGDEIIYTGQGGRDLNTSKQVTDQELVRGNLALALSAVRGLPVRVIRGANSKSSFAPEKGYRYDGLFRVVTYWQETGKSGYRVWRFYLVKTNDTIISPSVSERDEASYPSRKQEFIQRYIRNTAVSEDIKALYRNQCMVCNRTVKTPAGRYAEGAHIKPLGKPHEGPDIKPNLLCLCPNHHVMFDFGGFGVDDNLELLGIEGTLKVHPKHNIDERFLGYHREHIYVG